MTRTVLLAAINETLVLYGNPPVVVLGTAYSFTFQALFGSGTYVFSESGSLPTGLTFTDNGDGTATISGTTSVPGSFPITIAVQDTNRNRISKNFTIMVQALPLAVSGSAPNGTIGTSYTYTFTATGGVTPYTWSYTGTLPPGLSLNSSTGVLSGTPTGGGTYNFVVVCTDFASTSANSAPQSVTTSYATLTLTGVFTTPIESHEAVQSDILITGGDGTYTLGNGGTGLDPSSDPLPSGTALSIVTSGGSKYLRISGTPTTHDTTYNLVVSVHSGDGQNVTKSTPVQVYWYPGLGAFGSGERGVFLWFGDKSTNFTDTAGTTHIATAGDNIKRSNDKSGNGEDFDLGGTNAPTYHVDGSGYGYAQFTASSSTFLGAVSGSSNTLQTDTLSISVVTGVKLDSNPSNAAIIARSRYGSTLGRWWVNARDSGGGPSLTAGSEFPNVLTAGDSTVNTNVTVCSASMIHTSTIGGNSVNTVRRNQTQTATASNSGSVASYNGNLQCFIGAYNDSSSNGTGPQSGFYFDGRIYAMIVRIAVFDATIQSKTEDWVNRHCGAY